METQYGQIPVECHLVLMPDKRSFNSNKKVKLEKIAFENVKNKLEFINNVMEKVQLYNIETSITVSLRGNSPRDEYVRSCILIKKATIIAMATFFIVAYFPIYKQIICPVFISVYLESSCNFSTSDLESPVAFATKAISVPSFNKIFSISFAFLISPSCLPFSSLFCNILIVIAPFPSSFFIPFSPTFIS